MMPIMMFYTVREVADQLGLRVAVVRRLCQMGFIYPSSKIGNLWTIDKTFTILVPPGYHVPQLNLERGRPPGAKNVKPYPAGVKRPRRKAAYKDKRTKEYRYWLKRQEKLAAESLNEGGKE